MSPLNANAFRRDFALSDADLDDRWPSPSASVHARSVPEHAARQIGGSSRDTDARIPFTRQPLRLHASLPDETELARYRLSPDTESLTSLKSLTPTPLSSGPSSPWSIDQTAKPHGCESRRYQEINHDPQSASPPQSIPPISDFSPPHLVQATLATSPPDEHPLASPLLHPQNPPQAPLQGVVRPRRQAASPVLEPADPANEVFRGQFTSLPPRPGDADYVPSC